MTAMVGVRLLTVFTCLALFGPARISAEDAAWKTLRDGLQLARFNIPTDANGSDSALTVVRVDPAKLDIRLMAISETGDAHGRTARKWCETHGLVAAINAGMYAEDHSRHIGYMRTGRHVNSGKVVTRDYRSAAAFHPLKPDLPPFRIFDLDETEMDSILADYGSVVQNIRLIKRPGENRWSDKPQKWSEAALGEDKDGFMLFIFCSRKFAMRELNQILLSLPINLVCAQHLEGGPAAQLYLKHGATEIDLRGSYDSDFLTTGGNLGAWRIPNVIGIALRPD